jgi:Mrp family chromosome partitioning ATPase
MLVITSAGPEEGKTTIASNLAAIIAKGNKRVYYWMLIFGAQMST